ncbi:MAG: ketol-acid reductoisomerase [Rhodothalassiaceae bacterium]
MTRIFSDQDADRSSIDGPIAIIGYGSQGRAHARNLRDSGFEVIIGARPGGSSETRARADEFQPIGIAEAAQAARLIALLTPDMSHKAIFEDAIAPHLAPGDALLLAHGFSIHFGQIAPPSQIDTILVAPKGPGDLVRREFEIGRGVPCLIATHQDATGKAQARALAYAFGLGGTRAGAIETNFAEETETDLFGEQAILCGGATELVKAGFETLTEAGYAPEIAYFECLHELKLIVDLLYEGGFARMHQFISETATYGDLTAGGKVINQETRARMAEILEQIRSGRFAEAWIAENEGGKRDYQAKLDAKLSHPIETTGQSLRSRMAWLAQPKPAAQAAE